MFFLVTYSAISDFLPPIQFTLNANKSYSKPDFIIIHLSNQWTKKGIMNIGITGSMTAKNNELCCVKCITLRSLLTTVGQQYRARNIFVQYVGGGGHTM